MARNPFLYILPLAAAAATMTFVIVREATSTSSSPAFQEAGLTDEQRQSIHATAVADSVTQIRANAIEFAQSGASLDALPRAEIESITRRYTQDPTEAARAAAVVAFVQSEGAYIDQTDGSLRIKLRVIETIKGDPRPDIDIGLTGGPEKTRTGEWVLGLAPYELYLNVGETAILLLEESKSASGALRQRPYEALLVKDETVVARDGFALSSTLAGVSVDEARSELKGAAQ